MPGFVLLPGGIARLIHCPVYRDDFRCGPFNVHSFHCKVLRRSPPTNAIAAALPVHSSYADSSPNTKRLVSHSHTDSTHGV